MKTPTCKVGRRAFELGTIVEESHRASCAECAAEQSALAGWLALAQDLPQPTPNSARVEEIRAAVLAAGAERPPLRSGRWRWAAGIGGLALIGALLQQLLAVEPRPLPAPPVLRAQVQSARGSRYVHTPAQGQRPETVRFEEGQLELKLDPLPTNTPLLIATADAELEVLASRCLVVAEQGRLIRIEVLAGMVELRRPGETAMHLGEGASWERPAPPARAEGLPTEPPIPSTPPTSIPPKAPGPRTPAKVGPTVVAPTPVPADERAFATGWAALQARDYAGAIQALERVELETPGSALVEDASYGVGVALARQGRVGEAQRHLEQFLVRFPNSERADEVAVTLGWLLKESGDEAAARPWFERAQNSAVPRIRESALRGLAPR